MEISITSGHANLISKQKGTFIIRSFRGKAADGEFSRSLSDPHKGVPRYAFDSSCVLNEN